MTQDKTPKPDTSDHALGAKGTISQAGRSGGRLPRDIGTQDELKRANERPAGKTRVKKSDEKGGQSE
ncbi:hypothetical protein ROE7235_03288 [Roseibaca ekhonensis]|jgi:hypothetical protein|uniref:Uncharacterized protein n=1 Tax=Roseinatronobacter ekhonensis TaxID=254356 RepID=A0A3B0MR69_9RHOB|nr:hypothetical protein [Roseibaca ekhonensis]SUZ33517.1 hypothetical protein ROE7235_03288 [Roseibaca ekhonensis]